MDDLEARLATLFEFGQSGAAGSRPQARRMSAAARARISAAAKSTLGCKTIRPVGFDT
jgi:hypothetical protein